MNRLEAEGSAQTRKIYARHGAPKEMFGVSFENLQKLRKSIGVDHTLAKKLWATRNLDAQVLATMLAEPNSLSRTELDRWARESGCGIVVDSLVRFVARNSRTRVAKIRKWTQSSDEMVARAGWQTLASLATSDSELSEELLMNYLKEIEGDIHQAKNRTKESMNNALIAIGGRNARLGKAAISAAKRIGPVEVDHGETHCKTPDAVSYIKRIAERAAATRLSRKK